LRLQSKRQSFHVILQVLCCRLHVLSIFKRQCMLRTGLPGAACVSRISKAAKSIAMAQDGCQTPAWTGQAFPYLTHGAAKPAPPAGAPDALMYVAAPSCASPPTTCVRVLCSEAPGLGAWSERLHGSGRLASCYVLRRCGAPEVGMCPAAVDDCTGHPRTGPQGATAAGLSPPADTAPARLRRGQAG